MLLAIDVGNTNTEIGVFDGAELRASWRTATERQRMADEWGALLYTFLVSRNMALGDIDACIVSSVVPLVTTALREMSKHLLNTEAMIVDAELNTGVRVAIDNPREVGADRIANTHAAYHIYGGPCIVVDFGTATIFDVVGADGAYLGSSIAPGIDTAAEALYRLAARLYTVELTPPPNVIGKNTVHSMQSGIVLGYVSLVEGLVARIKREIDAPADKIPVIATGRLADLIAEQTSAINYLDQDLTLIGLRMIWEFNTAGQRTGDRGQRAEGRGH